MYVLSLFPPRLVRVYSTFLIVKAITIMAQGDMSLSMLNGKQFTCYYLNHSITQYYSLLLHFKIKNLFEWYY